MANMYLGEQAIGTVAVMVSTPIMEVTDDGDGNVNVITNGANISVGED